MNPGSNIRVLVAGVGNIFLGDDGFGVEVVRRLSATPLPEWVAVRDFGIRGLHLAYELLENEYELTILVDAMSRGNAPGTVLLLEPDLEALEAEPPGLADAHGMTPAEVFRLLRSIGGKARRVLVVGCEPENLDEGMELSPPVAAAVDEAARLVKDVLAERIAS